MLRGMGLDSVRLRWPNDLLAGKSKLAGILVERPAAHMAVIGIGINIFNDVAGITGMVQDPPARLADLVSDCPSIHEVMASLGSHLNRVFTAFFQRRHSRYTGFPGRGMGGTAPVTIATDDEMIHGIFTGIDDQGNPVLSLPTGRRTIPAHLVNRLTEN